MALREKKARSKWCLVETITEADNADYVAILTNTPALAESVLHILEQTAGSIGLDMNTNKT